jgi:hypothetical protein
MYVSGTYTNTGPLDLWNPSLVGSDGGSYPLAIDDGSGVLKPGHSVPFSFIIPAPGNVQSYALTLTPTYFAGSIGTACSATVPTYQEFNASAVPLAQLKPTLEDPSSADYYGKITITGTSHDIQFPNGTTATFYRKPTGGAQTNLAGPVSDGVHSQASPYVLGSANSNYSPLGTVNAGDQFCTDMTVQPTHGWVGPDNGILQPTGSDTKSNCGKVVNQPYTHFFGSDVTAGGGFGLSCQKTAKGIIYAYNETPGGAPNSANKGGTGAQFGAHAMDIIEGLGSANLRSSAPTGLSGLSFANTDHIGGSPPSQITGGYQGDAGLSNFCVPDYFSDKPSTLATPDTGTTATAGIGNAQQYYKPAGGTLTLKTGQINNGVNQAIFVDGNVIIEPANPSDPSDTKIKYDATARGSVKDIPSFYLIVKNGNIHIDPSVTQLDGVYVAQPDTTSATTINKTGIINTCWLANATNSIYNNCKNQLVVNGAFVANRVLLARSYSSLRYSQSGEHNMPGSARSCGNIDKDVSASQPTAPDCAAEIFNFSPELYMSQPAINARFGAPSGKYDSITSLSPVL